MIVNSLKRFHPHIQLFAGACEQLDVVDFFNFFENVPTSSVQLINPPFTKRKTGKTQSRHL